MKTNSVKFMLMGSLLLLAGFISSCSKSDDDSEVVVNKTSLTTGIAAATTLLSTTSEGTGLGQYVKGSQAALQSAIDAAQIVLADAKATQDQVNNATVALANAVTLYNGKVVEAIDPSNLVGQWTFDEITSATVGATVKDYSGNAHDGTIKAGPTTWGAGVPALGADRYGVANKAIHFTGKGGEVEIPYNTALNPTSAFSISLWIKADSINENNRFMGLQSWIGYKFQLQSTNVPFLTVGYGDYQSYNQDATQALPINEWHHIVATYTNANLSFYVDGVLKKMWDDAPPSAKSISGIPYNLVLGQDFPTDKYAAVADDDAFNNDHIIPVAWGGFFRGYIDEVRLYKSAISASQVTSIYNLEKP